MTGEMTLARRWAGELPLYVCAVVWGGICIGLAAHFGIFFGLADVRLNAQLFVAAALVLGGFDLILSLALNRPDSPISFLRERYFNAGALRRLVGGLPLLAICIVLLPFFSKMKSMIPMFNEYTWDPVFIAWDRLLFFGYDPWELLWPILGNPWVTAALAIPYHAWLMLLYLGTLFVIYARPIDHDLRRQFFLSYVLTWALLGGVLATMLASVGPVFAEPLLGIDTFAREMELLRAGSEQAPLMTLPVQDMLLERFHEDERGLGSGITAMPSMHVAIAFLFWLTMRRVHRYAGWFFGAFFWVIWVGSVHLAYHYAVDGLVSVIGVAAIWWVSGAVHTAWDRYLDRRTQATLRTNTVPAE